MIGQTRQFSAKLKLFISKKKSVGGTTWYFLERTLNLLA